MVRKAYESPKPRRQVGGSGRYGRPARPGRSRYDGYGWDERQVPRQGGWLSARRPTAEEIARAQVLARAGGVQGGQVWTGTGWVPAAQVVPGAVPAPTLPTFVTGNTAAPVTGPVVPVAAVRRPGDSVERTARWAWANRWPLTPVLGACAVWAGSAHAPLATTGLLTLGAAGLWVITRSGATFKGRMVLSERERRTAAIWASVAASIAPLAALGLPIPVVGGLLAAGTGWPAWSWIDSRRIRDKKQPVTEAPEVLSQKARDLIGAWPLTIGESGPDALLGSHIVADTMREPAQGTFAFEVELRGDVHNKDADGAGIQRALERAMRMPVDTVELKIKRDDSARVLITLSPDRALDGVSAPWPGPVLNAGVEGLMPLAVTEARDMIYIALWNKDGVEHLLLVGTSGAGKSTTSIVLLLPGVAAGHEVVIYIDGKKGQSASRVAGACDTVVTDPKDFAAAILAAHSVMSARFARRAMLGQDQWHTLDESEPVVTLFIEEAKKVLGHLPAKAQVLVNDIAQQGRSVGVRLAQVVHDPRGADTIGGKVTRDLMAGNGTVVALRPGGSVAGRLSLDSTSEDIDLTALPASPGWCAIVRKGTVLTRKARILWAQDDDIDAALAAITPRTLTGDDLAAAGGWYATAMRGPELARRIRANQAAHAAGHPLPYPAATTTAKGSAPAPAWGTPEPAGDTTPGENTSEGPRLNTTAAAAQADAETNRRAVLDALGDGPMTRAQIVETTELSRATVGRALTYWATMSAVIKTDDGTWALAGDE